MHRKVGDRSQLFLVMIQRCQIFHLRCRMDPLGVVTLQVLLISLSVLDFLAFPLKHLAGPSWCLPEVPLLSTLHLSPHQRRAQHLPYGGCRVPDLLDPGPSNHSHPCDMSDQSSCWSQVPLCLQQWGSRHCLVSPTSQNIYQGFFLPKTGGWCSCWGSYFLAVPLG